MLTDAVLYDLEDWAETWSWIERRILAFLASSKLALLRFDHLRLLTSLDAGEGEGDFEALGFNEGVRCCLHGT